MGSTIAMGICTSKANKMYKKIASMRHTSDDAAIRHMDVSTIFINTEIYSNTQMQNNDALAAGIVFDYNKSQDSIYKGNAMELTRVTSAQMQLINLYILDIQSTLIQKYKDQTEYREFVCIPNNIHHIITSYM